MRRALAFAALLLPLTACPPPTSDAPAEVSTPTEPEAPTQEDWEFVFELNEAQLAQKERALKAKKALGGALKHALEDAMKAEGPVAAVAVCNEQAPAIAAQVSTQGLKIGRTSHKLRNTANTPPDWAAEQVATMQAEPAFLAGPDGQLGALLPIKVGAACLVCHGPADAMSPELKAALAARYPQDQATGFAEGDLRGWFWIEVPAAAE